MEFLGWFTTLAFAICYWPQLYKTWRKKQVRDISVWPWIIQTIGYGTGLIYGSLLKQTPLIAGYAHGLICSVLFLYLYRRYYKNV